MSVLVDRETKVICQGMTGRLGTFHAREMMAYGTELVAGVRPGKGGRRHLDRPIFDRVREAVAETGANASIIFVPPPHAAEAMIEAIEAEVPLVVCVTERVPVLDMVRVRAALKGARTTLVGPNSQGVLAPDICKIGVMATIHAARGRIGIASRSASLTSEIVAETTALGLGQSTTIGVGGDPIHGIGFVECLELFWAHPETEGIILIGEIGGEEEEAAAAWLARRRKDDGTLEKPVVALVAGRHAPETRRMGHAGTLSYFGERDAATKIARLADAGAIIARDASDVAPAMAAALSSGKGGVGGKEGAGANGP